MKRGAVGLVSVASNIIPRAMSKLVRYMNEGEVEKAQAIHDKEADLMETLMGIDTNPVPIKAAVALMGQCEHEIRLPLVMLDAEKLATVKGLLEKHGLA